MLFRSLRCIRRSFSPNGSRQRNDRLPLRTSLHGLRVCHSSQLCMNVSKLQEAGVCPSHSDLCSMWGTNGSACVAAVFNTALQFWQKPPCVAITSCVRCAFCANSNTCMTVKSLELSSCGPWTGPCGMYNMDSCEADDHQFYFDAMSGVAERCTNVSRRRKEIYQ